MPEYSIDSFKKSGNNEGHSFLKVYVENKTMAIMPERMVLIIFG
jgi:hypothetical protein